jgi:hypothetical protein
MEIATLGKIFEFIKEKGEQNLPLFWKMKNNMPLTEEDLNVKGDLHLSNRNITSLPKGLKVYGNMSLGYSKVRKLPEGLEVGGTLNVSDSMISKLPKGLKVGGSLVISYTSIGILPKGLEVGGVIYAINSHIFNIDEIPKGVITEGIVTINKLIINSNLTISSDLDLSYSKITLLPKGLKVGGDLVLINNKIKSLPEGLEVGGRLEIAGTPLVKLSDDDLRKMVKPGFIKGQIGRKWKQTQ